MIKLISLLILLGCNVDKKILTINGNCKILCESWSGQIEIRKDKTLCICRRK